MPDWLVIADDLTGACDSGAAFAGRYKTAVALDPRRLFDAEVLVVNTESRYLGAEQAARAVYEAVQNAPDAARVYKKIDSTLRGHPAAELRAAMEALAVDQALIAPAFPDQGRVTLDGKVIAQGRVIGDLRAVFGGRLIGLESVRKGAEAVREIIDSAPGIWAADAETREDLLTLACAGLTSQLRLFCGSAGLARALAAQSQQPVQATVEHLPGPFLIAAGSDHPVTKGQLEDLSRRGVRAFSLPALDSNRRDEAVRIAARSAFDELVEGRPAALTVQGLPRSAGAEKPIAQALAALARTVLEQAGSRSVLPTVILTGGDTASALCSALNCSQIRLYGEWSAGIPYGELVDGVYPGLRVVTKAGGFGEVDTLARLCRLT